MLSPKIETALNKQLELEAYASFLYLSMASWTEHEGLEGTAKFFYRQSVEENDHMMRIIHYMLDMDGAPIIPQVKKPPHTFSSVQEIFEDVYRHEQKVTKAINRIVELAMKENDHATHNFLQWYVEEQREEEALMRTILDKLKLIGKGAQSLYFIDKEMEEINRQIEKAEGAEETK